MRIEGLHEIASRFDGMLIDQFGAWHQHLVDEGLNLRERRTC